VGICAGYSETLSVTQKTTPCCKFKHSILKRVVNKKYQFPSNIKHLLFAGYASQLAMLPTFTSFSMVHSFYASKR